MTALPKTAIDLPDAIQWHEGMLLAPQHFQQFAGRSELLVQAMAMLLSPFGWGLTQLEVDKAPLVGGDLRILNLEAIMPDGLLVTAGSERGLPLEIDLKPFADRMVDQAVLIHLTVPAQRSLSTRGDLARYASAEGPAVLDESSGEGSVYIPRLRPRLDLLVDDKVPSRFQSLPLLRVKVQDETYVATDYIAPMLSVSPGSPLADLCASVAVNVRERALYLSAQINSPGFDDTDPDAEGLRRRLASLVATLPVLEAVLASEMSHPYSAYLAMCSLAGQVASLSQGLVPPQFPAYNHNDLGATFQPVAKFIQRSLSEGISETWTKLAFELVDDVFQLAPNPIVETAVGSTGHDLSAPVLALGLRVPSGVPEETIVQWGESCVFGSESVIPKLLANRILGVQRRRVQRLEDLFPSRGVLLFALSSDPKFINPREKLILQSGLQESVQPSAALLYVRNRKSYEIE